MKVDLRFPPTPYVSAEAKDLISKVRFSGSSSSSRGHGLGSNLWFFFFWKKKISCWWRTRHRGSPSRRYWSILGSWNTQTPPVVATRWLNSPWQLPPFKSGVGWSRGARDRLVSQTQPLNLQFCYTFSLIPLSFDSMWPSIWTTGHIDIGQRTTVIVNFNIYL